jgi:L-fuculose-phosphate aldolase
MDAASLTPSSEWQMHHSLLELRADAEAVVHCHSRHATILACAGCSIPPVHYRVGVSGRACVPLAPYAPFGSRELADIVAATAGSGAACLMAYHGLVTLGPSLERALSHRGADRGAGSCLLWSLADRWSPLLSDEEMTDVLERLSRYGRLHRA